MELWPIDSLIDTNIRYEIFENLANTVAIERNGSSEFIAIEIGGHNNYRLVLSPFIGLDKQYHITIGDSFTDMFVRLDNGIEWFQ